MNQHEIFTNAKNMQMDFGLEAEYKSFIDRFGYDVQSELLLDIGKNYSKIHSFPKVAIDFFQA